MTPEAQRKVQLLNDFYNFIYRALRGEFGTQWVRERIIQNLSISYPEHKDWISRLVYKTLPDGWERRTSELIRTLDIFRPRVNQYIESAKRGEWGIEGTREKIINALKTEFPTLEELIASEVYSKLPDDWEKEFGLVKPSPPPSIPEPSPSPPPDWLPPEEKERLIFESQKQALIDAAKRGEFGIEKVREKIIDEITKEFPKFKDEAIKNVYSQLPDGWEKIYGLVKPEGKKLFDSIFEIREKIQEIIKNIFETLNKVKEIFENLISPEGWINKTLRALSNFFKECWKNLIDFFRDPIGKIKNAVSGLISEIRNWIKEIRDKVEEFVKDFWIKLHQTLTNFKNLITQEIIPKIEATFKQIKETLSHYVHEIVDPIVDTFFSFWERLTKFISEKIIPVIKEDIKHIGEFFKNTIEFFRKFGFYFFEELLKNIATVLLFPIGVFILPDEVKRRMTEIKKTWFDWIVSILSKLYEPQVLAYVHAIRGVLEKAGELKIEVTQDPEVLISKVYSVGVQAVGYSMVVGLAASIASDLKLPYVGGLLADYGNWQWAVRGLIRYFQHYAYEIPAEYAFRAKYQPILPPFRNIQAAFRRRIIDEKYFAGAYKYQGYLPTFYEAIKKSTFRPLDPFSFAFLSQTGYFREADWKWLVRDMGYREEVLDFLIKAPMMWGLSPFKTSIRTRLMNAVADGFLDINTAASVIQNLWSILDLKAVAEIEAKTRYWYETTKDKVDQLMDKYVKGLINENELRQQLTSGPTIHLHAEEPGVSILDVDLPFYVVNKERVEFYVEQAKVRKARKPREELLPDQKRYISGALISGYREGVLTENSLNEFLKEVEAIDNIESLILFRAKIVKLIEDEIEKKREEEREKWGAISAVSSVIIRRFAEGFIDEKTRDSLLNKAISIKDKKEAFIFKSEQEKLLEEELDKRREREKDLVNELRVLASVITNFYREGFWTKEKMESEIDASKKIVDIKEALKKRAELEREFEELMDKKRESRKNARNHISVVAGILTNMFKEGYISRETLESELTVAEKIYDPKGAYLMRADWEKAFEFISNSIKILTDKRLGNLISDGTLYSELQKLGVQEWKIELIFEEIELKTYGKTLPREIKLEAYYNDLKKILDKHLRAGFIKIETLKAELDKAKDITDPVKMFRLKVDWEKEYDSKVVSLMLYDDQFRRDIITEGVYLEKLKTIYAYPEYVDAHLAQIKAEKEAGVR